MSSNSSKDMTGLLQKLEQTTLALDENQSRVRQLEKRHHRVEQELMNMVKAQEKLYQFQEKIEQQKTIYAQIAEVGHQFNQTLNDEDVFKAVARICVDLLNFEKFVLLMPHLSGKELSVRIHGGYHIEAEETELENLKIASNDSLMSPFLKGESKWQVRLDSNDLLAQGWRKLFKVDEYCIYSLGFSDGLLKGLLMIGSTASHRSFHRTLAEEQELDALMGNVTSLIGGAQTAINFMQTIQSESAQVHRLLDNMKQAVFTVNAEGKINEPVSRQSTDIFKMNLVGTSIYETVFKDLPQNGEIRSRLDSAMATVFGESDLQWMLMSDQFPTEFVFRLPIDQGEDVRTLRSTVQPIWDESENLEKVMFVMEDITEIQKLEKQIEQEKFEVSVIRQILRNDLENVKNFFNQSAEFLWKALLQLDVPQLTPPVFSDLLRALHTLKGNARLFGFIEISKAIHEAETGLLQLKPDLLQEQDLGCSTSYLKAAEHFGSVTLMLFEHILVAEKVFRIQTAFKPFVFRFFIKIFDRQFQEKGLHARLAMSLLRPMTTGNDLTWIEDFEQKWEDLNSELTKNRSEVFSTALSTLRQIAIRTFLQSPMAPLETKELLILASYFPSSRRQPLTTTEIHEVHRLLEGLEPLFARQSFEEKEWVSYVTVSLASKWSQLQSGQENSLLATEVESILKNRSLSLEKLKSELARDWTASFNQLISCQDVDQAIVILKADIINFLFRSTNVGEQIPLCRLLAFARAISPLLNQSEISTATSYGTIEVADMNLKRLQQSVKSLSQRFTNEPEVQALIQSFQRLSDVPLKPFLGKFEAMVAEVSSSLNKKVRFSVHGPEISVPRSSLGFLQDVIVQILRNAIDHGLESPEERKTKQKPEVGSLEIFCSEADSRLEIRIKDDGRGIDPDHLLQISLKKGLISAENSKTLSQEEKINLIFLSGFSSKEEASDFSGRGVGMDIVKSTIEKLQGEIQVHSQVNHGTEFEMMFPIYFTSREI